MNRICCSSSYLNTREGKMQRNIASSVAPILTSVHIINTNYSLFVFGFEFHPLSKQHLSLFNALEISIVRKFRECRDSSPGRLGERHKCYLCVMPSPHQITVINTRSELFPTKLASIVSRGLLPFNPSNFTQISTCMYREIAHICT